MNGRMSKRLCYLRTDSAGAEEIFIQHLYENVSSINDAYRSFFLGTESEKMQIPSELFAFANRRVTFRY